MRCRQGSELPVYPKHRCVTSWPHPPPQAERTEKAQFLRGQERTAKGYMRNAKQTLALLNLLASSQSVAPAFLHCGVAGKAAYAVVHFLEVLLAGHGAGPGPRSPPSHPLNTTKASLNTPKAPPSHPKDIPIHTSYTNINTPKHT